MVSTVDRRTARRASGMRGRGLPLISVCLALLVMLTLARPAAASATISQTPEWPRAGDVVVFTNTTDGAAPAKVAWDFGDGTTTEASGAEEPSHTYAAPGIYTAVA